MDANDQHGIFVDSVSPLGFLPTEASGATTFRVTMRLVIFDQKMHFDIETPAHSFDEAAQLAYLRVAQAFPVIAGAAKKASDALLSKLGKPS